MQARAVDIVVVEAVVDIVSADVVVVDTAVQVAVAPRTLFELLVGASQIDKAGTYC